MLNSIPPEMTQWTSSLPLHPTALDEAQAANAFDRVNEMLLDGAGRFGHARGSGSILQAYEPIWQLDEAYGPGTAEALAGEGAGDGEAR